jgi:hypothetical protein
VKEALRALEAAHQVRHGDDGYRIPTPAEDDWERLRNGISPKPGDSHRLYQEVLSGFWQPQPSHTLFDTKTFKAGLAIHGREITAGDMMFQVHLAEDGKDFDGARRRAAHAQPAGAQARLLGHRAHRLHRSRDRRAVPLEGDARPQGARDQGRGHARPHRRGARSPASSRRRASPSAPAACLSGRIYFRGNDRSPTDRAVDVGKTAAEVLGRCCPRSSTASRRPPPRRRT